MRNPSEPAVRPDCTNRSDTDCKSYNCATHNLTTCRAGGVTPNRLSVAGALALAVLAVAVQHGAGAQPADKVARVRVLWPGELSPAATQLFARFREALRGLGWVEGRNLALDFRAAEGRSERLPELAAALVETQPDVDSDDGSAGSSAGDRNHSDRVRSGGRTRQKRACSQPLAARRQPHRIGGHAPELHAKRLEVLKDAFPRVRRIAVVWNPTNVLVYDAAGELRAAGPALGVELGSIQIRRREEFPAVFRQIEQSGADALSFLGDTTQLAPNTGDTIALAATNRLPAIPPYRRYVDAGGLLSYGSNIGDFFARAATTVDKVLKGAKPADLPVEQPTKFELVINLKTARAMGFDFPQAFLERADEVIE